VIEELGHEPNGYFWAGVAQLLVDTDAPHLRGRFNYDPEGGMFVAHGSDRPALDELAVLLTAPGMHRGADCRCARLFVDSGAS
jgi:hypothetical protein